MKWLGILILTIIPWLILGAIQAEKKYSNKTLSKNEAGNDGFLTMVLGWNEICIQ